jgi:pimeloyl-ACP methyl ester carboxylesterase
MPTVPYDEFSMLHENATEWSIPYSSPPPVTRIEVPIAGSRRLSALRWGRSAPEAVLLHGGAQNAHTFDTVALALDRPLLAVDLPGHGHSDAAPRGLSDIEGHARDLVSLLGALGIADIPLVGMSLGGLVALAAAVSTPSITAGLALIDVTPGVTSEKARHVVDFVRGPESFDDLEELVARTRSFIPDRPEQAIRRGVLHNAVQRDDGTWVWRHQRHGPADVDVSFDTASLWSGLSGLAVPLLLVRAMGEGSVVDDEDERRFRTVPHASVVHVNDSGHAVQSDQPLELARVLASFLAECTGADPHRRVSR